MVYYKIYHVCIYKYGAGRAHHLSSKRGCRRRQLDLKRCLCIPRLNCTQLLEFNTQMLIDIKFLGTSSLMLDSLGVFLVLRNDFRFVAKYAHGLQIEAK